MRDIVRGLQHSPFLYSRASAELRDCTLCWFRQQGVGKQLLKELLKRAGGADVVLTTISSRVKFYEDQGFARLSFREVPR